MDPRGREDDGKGAALVPIAVIPAEPALDEIGGQESIVLTPDRAPQINDVFDCSLRPRMAA